MPQWTRLSLQSSFQCRSSKVYPPQVLVALFTVALQWLQSTTDSCLPLARTIPRRNRQFAIRRGSVKAKRTRLMEALISPAI